MDPLSALGLAGNIVAFIDLSYKVISGMTRVLDSASGMTQENANLSILAEDLNVVSQQLISDVPARTENEKQLCRLSSNCYDLSKELVQLLRRLRVGDAKSTWQAARVKWQSMRREKDVWALERRLQGYQAEILIRLQIMFSAKSDEQHSLIRDYVDALRGECKSLENQATRHLDSLHQDIAELVETIQSAPQKDNTKGDDNGPQEQGLAKIQDSLAKFRSMTTAITRENYVLGRLSFASMYTRSDSIAAAEGRTFAWMVGSEAEQQDGRDAAPVASTDELTKRDKTRQCFLTWLASERHVFHISGKAGSGKSTLMKFLARSSRVQAELRRWAGDNPLIFAQFFFWNSGDRLQASLEGLYRSLLFEICRQSPDLIPRIFPDIWAGLLAGVAPPHNTPITLEEVKHAFDLFTQLIGSLPSYICLFIDGLDEFEGDEVDHWHLARYLQSWTQSPNIKLCVSSRPHVTFLQSFANSVNRQINVHELTREDICQFSLAMFEKDPNFARIKDSYRELVDDIVGHSNGVFLWARLAVRSLLRSVGYQVTGEELKRKLKAMPKGLDGLFDQILGSINPEDQSLSDTLFLLTIPDFCRWQPIVGSAIAYSWLEDLANPDFPWKQPMRACSETEIKERLDRVSCLLDRLSRGLLEMFPKRSRDVDGHDYFVYEVRFLHRTAREYLAGTRQREMETRVPDINVYSGILRLMLAEVKFARPTLKDLSRNMSQYGSRGGPLRTHLNKTITVMQSAIAQGYEIPRRILEEFSTIASGHAQPVDTPQQDSRCQTECHLRGQNLQTSLSDCWPTIRESNYPSCIFSEFTLRSMQALLPPDLRCQLKRQTLESGPNLLLAACDSGDVELVQELLQDGRTPGEIVELEVVYGHCEDPGQGDTKGAETTSVWLLCLFRFGYSCLSMRNHTRSVIVELLLRAGADGNVQFIITKRSSEGLQREATNDTLNDTLAGANAEQVTGRKYVMSLLELVELVEPPNLKEIRAILESRRSWWDRLTRWTLTSNLQNVEDDESESFKRVYKSALPAEGTYAPFGILGDFYIESVITPSERLDLPFSFRVT